MQSCDAMRSTIAVLLLCRVKIITECMRTDPCLSVCQFVCVCVCQRLPKDEAKRRQLIIFGGHFIRAVNHVTQVICRTQHESSTIVTVCEGPSG